MMQAAAWASWFTTVSAIFVNASSVAFSSCSVASRSSAAIRQAELLRPRPQRAIARNFVMLDRLGCREQAGIQGGRALVVGHDLLALAVRVQSQRCQGFGGFSLRRTSPRSFR
jgi:hypothetical protein